MIFYLSGTGNTLWAAQRIADATGERLIDVASVVEGECHFTLQSGERLGFCFPIHGWRPPKLMRRFVSKVVIEGLSAQTYCFALCTVGDTIGYGMKMFRKDFSRFAVPLSAVFSLRMPNTYIGLPLMDVDNAELEHEKLAVAAGRISKICNTVLNCEQSQHLEYLGTWRRINTYVIGAYFAHRLVTDRHFKVSPQKCIGCGKCVANCPVGDISLTSAHHPSWQHNGNCMTCFSCYHHCPVKAISFGSATKGKGQYYFLHKKGK